jgi:hypothetical protein
MFRDLLLYYTAECIIHIPNFITNAEVLGLNVADLGNGTYKVGNDTYKIVCDMANPAVGDIGGAAVKTAVDAAKGGVAEGKK